MTAQTGDRRAQIVAAAYRAIAREGVAAISTRKIAGEAAVNLATLHSLFGSKDALLIAVLDQVTGRMIDALAPSAEVQQGLRAALTETAAALWALTDREPRLPLVRCDLLLYLERRPAHAQQARAQQERYLAALADLYRQSGASTDARVACQTLAQLVASHVDGLALQGAFLDPTKTTRHIRSQALRAVLALVEEDVPPTDTPHNSGKRPDRGSVRRQRPAARGTRPGVGAAR